MAALAGTAVGSMVGSYLLATRASKKRYDSARPEPLPAPTVDLGPLNQKMEALERELHQEVRAIEAKIANLAGEALTVEEFQTYVRLDGERRERLIAKIGELQGSLAALLPNMRK